MTREEWIRSLNEEYEIVSKLSDRGGNLSLRLRHKELGRDMVLHSLAGPSPVYELLCGISQENLPCVYDVMEADDGQIVLEEYLDGVTLFESLEVSKYRYPEAKRILRSLCRALSCLHENGYVHRDIKPENIVLTREGKAVLIDFGAARKVTCHQDTRILGTVGYASPEQILAQSDARTDVYALGILLNVMLTGLHPSQQMAKGKAGRIVRKCTMTTPADRYQSVKKLYRAL